MKRKLHKRISRTWISILVSGVVVLAISAPGEADFDERLGPVTIQFQFDATTGRAVLSDLALAEAIQATEWECRVTVAWAPRPVCQ